MEPGSVRCHRVLPLHSARASAPPHERGNDEGKPLTNGQAWKIYEALQADARIRFFPEWPALDGLLKTYSDVNQAATNLWGDAYLAAYAAVNGATLVTFDKGFAKYPVKSLILEPA